ncbi:hypothetical protein OH76DRAFT_1395050, partial [Lentinus brumalis]
MRSVVPNGLFLLAVLLSSHSTIASALPIPYGAISAPVEDVMGERCRSSSLHAKPSSTLHPSEDNDPHIRPWAIYHGQAMH